MEDNTKLYSDIIENDSEVQPPVSTVEINIEEPNVEEPKQRSDVSPDDYTRELVLSGLTDELRVATNRRSLNLPPVSLFSSDDELLSNFSDRSTTESSEVSEPKSYTSVLEKLLEFEEISMEIRNPSSKTGKHLSPIPLCLQEPTREIVAFMSPTEVESDENNKENINVPSISDDLKNAWKDRSLYACRSTCWISKRLYAMIVLGVTSTEPEKSTGRQPRPKRRFLSALGRGLLKVSRSLCCWRCK